MIEMIITALVTISIIVIIVIVLSCLRIASIEDQRLEKAYAEYMLRMKNGVDESEKKSDATCK